MSEITEGQILEVLKPRLSILGLSVSDIDSDKSLLEQGILDSMSFLEFIVDLETSLGVEFDLSELDPSQFTSINKIQKLINNGNRN